MSRPARPAVVRFYVDADALGLARILVQVRSDVTYPGDPGGVLHKRQRPPCSITSPAVLDTEWIPETARQGWLIITRDANIAAVLGHPDVPASRRPDLSASRPPGRRPGPRTRGSLRLEEQGSSPALGVASTRLVH